MDLELKTEAEQFADKAKALEAFSAVNLGHIRGEVAEALTAFGRLGLLEEYTKHDITHIDAMLDMYRWVVPKSTKDLMTPADWLLVTLSTYLHDFGLLITRDEYDARERLTAFSEYKKRVLERDDPSSTDYRAQILKLDDEARERFLYQEFVRANHARRIRGWLQEAPDLTWGGDPSVAGRLYGLVGQLEDAFVEDVALVCESHHLDDVYDLRKYPTSKPYGRTRGEEANVQYAAFLLRTTDLLHITKDRVPSMAAVVINPRNPKSQVEWAKQRSVRSVRPAPDSKDEDGHVQPSDSIEVHATFKEAEGYFGLTAYLQYATTQLAKTAEWCRASQASGHSEYTFPWRRVDMSHIQTKGFVAEPFEFSLDQSKILDLLTGHTLYNDTGVVVRELMQNALDAVRLRAHIETGEYSPRVEVFWNSAEQTLRIQDNGVGMSQATIENNFLKVGSSRYQEPDFRKQHPEFTSISRFGIGVLSAFMVADDVSVATCYPADATARQLSLRDVHGQYLVRLVDKQDEEIPDLIREHGTSISIRLRPSADLSAIEAIVRHWVVFPGCEVWLTIDAQEPMRIGFDSTKDALEQALVDANLVRRVSGGLLDGLGQPVEVRTETASGVELSFAVTWSRWIEEWRFLVIHPGRFDYGDAATPRFGLAVGGVRVTTEPVGFRQGGIAAIANATGPGAPRTNVARSAIEKTEEYDALLSEIYGGYARHISHEMQEMTDVRHASSTRAAHEASYLVNDMSPFPIESRQILRKVLRAVPGFVLESQGVRLPQSLTDLEDREQLVTMESRTIANVEGVLLAIRRGADATLATLLAALGSDESVPSDPLISGIRGTGTLQAMFAEEWEVSRIESSGESRSLTATWSRIGGDARWRRPARHTDLPAQMSAFRNEPSWRVGREREQVVRLAASDAVEVAGISEQFVVCQGQLLVLPGNPLLNIEAANPDISAPVRDWGIAMLALSAWQPEFGGGLTRGRYGSDAASLSTWAEAAANEMRRDGLGEVLSIDSVARALKEVNWDVFDVSRWDRRSEE